MSLTSRTVALSQAVTTAGAGSDADLVLGIAEQFHTFITQDDVPAAVPTAPAAPAPTPAPAAKPAKAAKAPKPAPAPRMVPEDEPPAEESGGEDEADGEAVKATISQLLKGGLRDECVALLKQYKATSFSGIKEADYGKFVAEGKGLLANAALGA